MVKTNGRPVQCGTRWVGCVLVCALTLAGCLTQETTLRLRYEDLLDSTVARAKLTGLGPDGKGIAELEVITDALALLEEKTHEMV